MSFTAQSAVLWRRPLPVNCGDQDHRQSLVAAVGMPYCVWDSDFNLDLFILALISASLILCPLTTVAEQ